MGNDKQWKVVSMWDLNNIYQVQHVMVGFKVNKPIPEDKYELIKAAIEDVLNLINENAKVDENKHS